MSIITAEPRASEIVTAATRPATGWLVSPWIDLLFIANVAWPLMVLMQFGEGFNGRAGLQFWQIYFVTTPHRWITLLLVFLDAERFERRRALFLGLAAGAAAVCLGVRLTTGALTCLLAVDYLWNAWHFAAQHHGIYRIYRRRDDPPSTWWELVLEKGTMRGFLLYVTFRIVSATWSEPAWEEWLHRCDWVVMAAPVWLLVRAVWQTRAGSAAAMVYLGSVLALYSSVLWAVHTRRLGLVLCLATASALFHAIEYLSLTSWSVRQRSATLGKRMGLLGHLMPRWTIVLTTFVLILGSAGWLMDQDFREVWLTLNVIVAFLHYAYDGLIWRRSAA